jgi:hypothetical protein
MPASLRHDTRSVKAASRASSAGVPILTIGYTRGIAASNPTSSWRGRNAARPSRSIGRQFRRGSGKYPTHQRGRKSRENRQALLNTLEDPKRLAYLRDHRGLDTQLSLDAGRDLFQAQLDLAKFYLQDTLTVVQLYKAPGGGWQ